MPATMKCLRTPDERFVDLAGYPWSPNYADVPCDPDDVLAGELRVHYLDAGPRDGDIVLLMHGEPSWSYLYRHMIPLLTDAGHRVITPDLVGFGRSDKPADRLDYTFARHVFWMRALLVDALDLTGVTLVAQDWGGLIGLRLVAEHVDRFDRVVAANTFLPTGDFKVGDAFLRWQEFSQTVQPFAVGSIVNGGCTTDLSAEVIAAYDAPFPDDSYKEGARQFPMLVPTRPDDPASDANRAAWEILGKFEKPFLTAFSDGDPIMAGIDPVLHSLVPGTAGQPHTTIVGGGHFLQEDRGPELANVVNTFITGNPLPS